jgi:hypothetical protein
MVTMISLVHQVDQRGLPGGMRKRGRDLVVCDDSTMQLFRLYAYKNNIRFPPSL